jgi:hypothetical protein
MDNNLKIDPSIAYDVVQLPSGGIHYTNNRKSLRVAYLTASDENILSSPNLLQSDSVVDELLKRKILDRDFDINDLVNDDRQAILIFLRNTAFGSDYKITMTDPKTKEPFEATIDLSVMKTRDLTLIPDANGEYEFYMEVSKVPVTFKFLNNKQEQELEKIRASATGNTVAPTNTKRLEMMIKSVNGERSLMPIYNFIQNMPIKDSQDFKRFATKNKPGLDLLYEVITPSGEKVPVLVDFGVDFFRPFYGI